MHLFLYTALPLTKRDLRLSFNVTKLLSLSSEKKLWQLGTMMFYLKWENFSPLEADTWYIFIFFEWPHSTGFVASFVIQCHCMRSPPCECVYYVKTLCSFYEVNFSSASCVWECCSGSYFSNHNPARYFREENVLRQKSNKPHASVVVALWQPLVSYFAIKKADTSIKTGATQISSAWMRGTTRI